MSSARSARSVATDALPPETSVQDDSDTEDETKKPSIEQPFWYAGGVPPEKDDVFQRVIHGNFDSAHENIEDGADAADSLPNPENQTYSSIGDQGTTASINAYGELIQFGRYLGARTSGLFVVDQTFGDPSWEPYMVVDRATGLQTRSRERRRITFGLEFPEVSLEDPRLSYLGYRWPRYEYRTEKCELAIQWMVRDGIVLQQCLLTNRADEDTNIQFEFNNPKYCMVIRDLDYLNGRNQFNESYGGYCHSVGPNGYSYGVMHQFPPPESQGGDVSTEREKKFRIAAVSPPGAVAVVVSIFLNGSAMKWSGRNTRWTHRLAGSASPSATMEVICAYKMVLLPESKASWQDAIIPAQSVNVSRFLREETQAPSWFTLSTIALPSDDKPGPDQKNEEDSGEAPQTTPPRSATPTSHIEFLIRRNLENILSNCAIPLSYSSEREGDPQGGESMDPSDSVVPTALTCGDMSGHRICTSASFFAFWFLVESAKRLKQLRSEDPYVCQLLSRIETVCRGHLRWLERAERFSSGPFEGCFAANYWVTGKIMESQSMSYTPPDSLTDTAFQIIKAALYSEVYEETVGLEFSQRIIMDVCEPWVRAMDKLDKRSSFAWPHTQASETNVFRLDDHVWIWKGLKSIEYLGLWTSHQLKTLDRGMLRKFNPNHVQREMLRRFTTENSVSRKRMLAVTRSSLETRFLFHARDTALFYGSSWNFFLQDTMFCEVWDNSIEAQPYHIGNQETAWDNALRYALAIVMGARGHRINKRSPAEVVKSSLAVLFKTTSPSGFFPGQLDSTTKEPTLFFNERDRDFYFHASFEIPFVLLDNAQKINSICQSDTGANPRVTKRANTDPQSIEMLQFEAEFADTGGFEENTRRVPARSDFQPLGQDLEHVHASVAMFNKDLVMKKTLPYSRFIDTSSIVNMDEEWLYNYPPFLSGEGELSATDLRQQLEELEKQGIHASGAVIRSGIKSYLKNYSQVTGDIPDFQFDERRQTGMVADTAKNRYRNMGRRSKNVAENYTLLDNMEFWDKIKPPRTAQKAKKRFIWLPSADAETALACFASSPESERGALSLFFDRHADLTGYFFDDTTMYLNTWETEIHLSFYQLLGPGEVKGPGIPDAREEKFPGRVGRKIVKASMGFRFVGDIFDRYWTCHSIEYVPAKERSLEELPFSYWPRDDKEEKAWRQRKVLELDLFERILTTLLQSTEDIYNVVRSEFGLQKGAFSVSITNSDEYFSADWLKYQYMLEAVERELASGLAIISKWETRDKDRGLEKPRWTRNDEQTYGVPIKKLLSSTNRKIRDMKSVHDNIKTLKETLISSQEHIRDDLGLRGAEDIRFFTYVTVVFLPLGFASSLFSMSDSPSSDLVSNMAICAVVALAITLVALVNAKSIGLVIGQCWSLVGKAYGDYTRATMRTSSLIQERVARKHPGSTATDEETAPQQVLTLGEDTRPHSKKPGQKAIYSWFWLTYLVIELPARRVLLGYEALREPRPNWATVVNVIFGVLLLPFCILTWLIQVFLYNFADLSRLVWGWAIWLLPSPSSGGDSELSKKIAFLTHPPEGSRPIKALDAKLSGMRTQWASSKNQPIKRQNKIQGLYSGFSRSKDLPAAREKTEKDEQDENIDGAMN